MIVYLAGAITSVTFEEASEWRRYAEKKFSDVGIKVFNPIPDTCDKETAERLSFTSKMGNNIYLGKYIVDKDLAMIAASTVILVEMVNPKIPYYGTICEMVEAKNMGKIVIVWSQWAGKHPWIANYSTVILPTLDDCINFIFTNMCMEDRLGRLDEVIRD